jgi:ribosome-associated heat shock protein Hsp15
MEKTRIDKWLWAARLYKTRSLATEAVQRGWVQVSDLDVKPSREIRVGDVLKVLQSKTARTLLVKGISDTRGSAPVAQQLYEETAESVAKRQQQAEQNRLSPEPALAHLHGRPTKRDRRRLERLQ